MSTALLNENHVKSLLNHIDLTPYLAGPACIIVLKKVSYCIFLKNSSKLCVHGLNGTSV
jgi:hypothetical protein